LYIHIPFCAAFCDYCDFYSIKTKDLNSDYIDNFLNALIADINSQIEFFAVKNIPTVYIGGGTPSVLGTKISRLFDALKKIKGFSPCEFTVEANPESVSEEFLAVCRDGGVNRLSLGVQTFNEQSRCAINRQGSHNILNERIALVKNYFPGSLCIDLITGLPYQNEKIVLEDIKRILDYEPSHISLYSLSVEANTPLKEKIKTKTVILPTKDTADSLWLSGRDALIKNSFQHYEVSNFALDGKKSLHNIRYWQMQSWLGAGPSASGTIVNEKSKTAKRFTYNPDVDAYIDSPRIKSAVCEEIDTETLLKDSLLMGFRYIEGPNASWFKDCFGISVEECIPKTLNRWKEKDRMLFLNSFLCDAFEELD
jgi:oxygen-independent coproporphyrinogen-3 oxidase